MEKTKKQKAVEFIDSVRAMEPAKLQTMIDIEAGKELTSFFLVFAGEVIKKSGVQAIPNASGLMVMGYLVRATGNKTKSGAIDFISRIRQMKPKEVEDTVVKEAGEELAVFFLDYSLNLLSKDPERLLENASSLMLVGYLIRAAEDAEENKKLGFTMPPADA